MKNISIICPYETTIPLQVTAYRALMPRYGTIIVAAALKRAGYNVKLYCELSGGRVDWNRVYASDIVCFSFLSFSARKAYEYSERIRRHSKAKIIIGGSHASVLPEECLNYCDYVVRNEGEETIVELLSVLSTGGSVGKVTGISYVNNAGKIVHNPNRVFIVKPDLIADPELVEGYGPKNIFFYLKDTFRNGVPRFNMALAQGSRGCPFNCEFCFVKNELGNVYRARDPELVIREVEQSVRKLKTKYVFFADNDFTLDRKRTLIILSKLEQLYRGDIDLFFFARIFIARDKELMEAIERAGRACIAVGIESLERETLDAFRKHQTYEDIEECLGLFRKYKVKTHALFMCGADTDSPGDIDRVVELVSRYKVFNFGLCCLYDFPSREKILGFRQAIPDNRFIHKDWRFYSGNFVIHYPKRIRPSVLQKEMMAAYHKFYQLNSEMLRQYQPTRITANYYITVLRDAEAGLYDNDGTLREDLLPGPIAEERKLNVRLGRFAMAGELAGFYWDNFTRKQSWEFLFSLFKKSPANETND
jgi:radical SAM superfamily enzyme YgiQ (UPF0313 family)